MDKKKRCAETNTKPGLNFYLGEANRIGIKIAIPNWFVWSCAWHTKFKKMSIYTVDLRPKSINK